MRRAERAYDDAVWNEMIFNDALFMTLALVDGDEPYAVPLNFVYLNGALYFHCASKGKKLDLITVNPNVSVSVVGRATLLVPADGTACNIGMSYESIIVSGKASVVANLNEQQEAMNALVRKFGGDPSTMPPRAIDAVRIVKIGISTLTGKRANIS